MISFNCEGVYGHDLSMEQVCTIMLFDIEAVSGLS